MEGIETGKPKGAAFCPTEDQLAQIDKECGLAWYFRCYPLKSLEERTQEYFAKHPEAAALREAPSKISENDKPRSN